MTPKQRVEYESLASVAERAEWLLAKGVTAKIDVDPTSLSLVARAVACGVYLPGQFDSEEDAIKAGTKFLTERLRPAVTPVFAKASWGEGMNLPPEAIERILPNLNNPIRLKDGAARR